MPASCSILGALPRPNRSSSIFSGSCARAVRRSATNGTKNAFAVWYFFSRALARSEPEAADIIERRIAGMAPGNVLDAALAANSLLNIGRRPPNTLIDLLLASQLPSGAWPRAALYHGGRARLRTGSFAPPHPDTPRWGSDELTTAFCIEALVPHDQDRRMTGHLIHIGYAKTGSNFLRRWFSDHPQLDFVDGGIAGFRDIYEISRRSAAPTDGILYRVSSSEALATPHPWVGLPAIDYDRIRADHMPAAQAEACATLAALFPNARVLLVTRGFRSMMMSAYSQYARSGGEDDLFALAEGGEGSNAWNYDHVIGLYRSAFGDGLIVLPYELLRDDADAFVRELERRLGLSLCPAPELRLNSALSPEELSWYPRIARLVRKLPIGDRARRRSTRPMFVGRWPGTCGPWPGCSNGFGRRPRSRRILCRTTWSRRFRGQAESPARRSRLCGLCGRLSALKAAEDRPSKQLPHILHRLRGSAAEEQQMDG